MNCHYLICTVFFLLFLFFAHGDNLKALYYREIFGDEGSFLGKFTIFQGQEPVDAMKSFCTEKNLNTTCLAHIMPDVCKTVNCTRSTAVLWEKEVNFADDKVETLKIEDGVEPVDAIHSFCKEHSSTELATKACRKQLLNIACHLEGAPILSKLCTRTDPLLFDEDIVTPDGNLGRLQIYESINPADAIYKFVNDAGYPAYYFSLLSNVCEKLTCTRAEPVIYRQMITIEGGENIGELEVLESMEPADSVFNFVQKHRIPLYQRSILNRVCKQITCNRYDAVVFNNRVNSPTGDNLGILQVLENQEGVDAIHSFLKDAKIEPTEVKVMKTQLLNHLCGNEDGTQVGALSVPCKRRKALVYSERIITPEGNNYGYLNIYDEQEASDVIYDYLKQYGALEYRHSLMVSVCKQVTCTRLEAITYRQEMIGEGGKKLGKLEILEGREVADQIYDFTVKYDCREYFNGIVASLCQKLPCSRYNAKVFDLNINNELGQNIGRLVVMNDEEPIDVVHKMAKSSNLGDEWKLSLTNHVCSKLGTCTRFKALLYNQTISLDGVNEGKPVGLLEIWEDEEPADVVHSFVTEHGVDPSFKRSLLINICNQITITCTREERAIFKQNISFNGRLWGNYEILEGEEPANAADRYLKAKGLPYHDLFEPLRALGCKKSLCALQRAVKLKMDVDLIENDTEDTNDEDVKHPSFIKTLTIYGNEEPADAVFKFVKEYSLSESQRNNIMIHVCEKVVCTRKEAILFTQPIVVGGGQNAGRLTIYEGEEPIDQVQRFMVTSTLLKAGYSHHFIMDAICKIEDIHCDRDFAEVIKIGIPKEDDLTDIVETILLKSGEEPVDILYEAGLRHNISEELRRTLLSNVCGSPSVHCTRPHALVYELDVLNSTLGDQCYQKRAGWRWLAAKSWIPIEKLADGYESAGVRQFTQENIFVNIFFDLPYEALCIIAIAFSIIWLNMTLLSVGKHIDERVQVANIKALRISSSFVGFFMGCFIVVILLMNENKYDEAMYKSELVGVLKVFEHDEVTDVVYDFVIEEKQAKIGCTRIYSPVQDDTIDFLCSDSTDLVCNRRNATKVIGKIELTQYGIKYPLEHRTRLNESECVPVPYLGEWINTCVVEDIEQFCSWLRPAPSDCLPALASAMNGDLAHFNKTRWMKDPADHYHTLGLLRDASYTEIDLAYRALNTEYLGNTVPYAPVFGNMTNVDHHWEWTAQRRGRVEGAYKDLHDPEERSFWDQPCEWLFGGAMCARRTADGGMKILVGNNT